MMIAWVVALACVPAISQGLEIPGIFFAPLNSDSLTEGDYVSAIRDYQTASQLNPANVNARMDLARLYIATREYGRAVDEVEAARLLVTDPKTLADLDQLTARLYVRIGAYDKALARLTPDAGNDFLTGYCREKLGDWELALQHFNAVQPSQDEFDDYASYHRAYCLCQLGRYEEALQGFQSFMSDYPLSVYFSFAEDATPSCYEGMKNYLKAIHLRNEIVRGKRGHSPAMRYYIGRDYEALKDPVRAREQYIKVMVEDPVSNYALLSVSALKDISGIKGRTLYHAGRVCYYHGQFRDAKSYLNSYIKGYPRGKYARKARYLLARSYANLRMYSDAEISFQQLARSVASEKERAEYLFNLAKIQDTLEEDEDADSTFSMVEESRGSSLRDDATYRKGLILEKRDDMAKALETYLRVDRGDYADNALYRAGIVALASDRPDLAREAFCRLIYLFPDTGFRSAAGYWLARVFERMDSLDIATRLWRSVAQSDPLSYYGYVSQVSLKENGQENSAPQIVNCNTEAWISAWAGECSPLSQYESGRLERGLKLIESGLTDVGESEFDRIDTDNPLKALVLARAYSSAGLDYKAISLAEGIISKGIGSGAKDIPTELVRMAYPLSFIPAALRASDSTGVDPFLVLAIMRQESRFLPDAISPVGAVGLMQIMPNTGEAIAKETGRNEFRPDDLLNPDVSVSLGSYYVKEQAGELGSIELALAAYNAGPDVVRKWTKRKDIPQIDLFTEMIPYKETRLYVKAVLANEWTYQRVWGATSFPVP
jgi:soluble lytic murein transglycosylase